MNLKERAKQIKQDIPTAYFALRDRDTPILAKVLAGLAVGYALSPIDLIPDFVPVLGYLDDVIILPAILTLTMKLVPKEVWARSRLRAAGLWKGGVPRKWYCAIPIVLLWVWLAQLILRRIWTF